MIDMNKYFKNTGPMLCNGNGNEVNISPVGP